MLMLRLLMPTAMQLAKRTVRYTTYYPVTQNNVDVNKDGVINNEDQGIIGCGQPTFNWGWNNTFNYKEL